MHRGQKAADLANTLIFDFKAAYWRQGYARLDSYKTICKHYGISSKTVANAVNIIASRGFLIKINSRHVYLADPKRFPDAQALHAAIGEKKFAITGLEEMVSSGKFKAGTQLPKISCFSEIFGVSPSRITATLRELQKKGMVVKHGKKWLVGLPVNAMKDQLSHITSSYQQSQPEVLFISRDMNHYYTMTTKHLYRLCFDTMCRRLLAEGINYKIVYAKKVPSEFNSISGFDEIESYLEQCKDRIRGIFIFAYSADIYPACFFARFCRHNKPVVVFDPSFTKTKPLTAIAAQYHNCFILSVDVKQR